MAYRIKNLEKKEKKVFREIPKTIKQRVYWSLTDDGRVLIDEEEMGREFEEKIGKISKKWHGKKVS